MHLNNLQSCLPVALLVSLFACAALCPAASAPAGEKVFNFADQYIQIEAGIFPAESRNAFGLEVRLTPTPEWKLCVSNSSSIKPLRIRFSPAKCLKLKGATHYPPADLSVTDDSGAYSEYYTKTASVRQEFSRLNCTQKNGFNGAAFITYLLCQDNKCVGPFSKEIRFKAPEKK